MIKSWRDAWGEADFDFLIVSAGQLRQAADRARRQRRGRVARGADHDGGDAAQRQALAIVWPMRTIPQHSSQEQARCGLRLSLVAEATVYGNTTSFIRPGVRLDEGGKRQNPPDLKKLNDGLCGQRRRGAEGIPNRRRRQRKWHWADAAIDGESVIVSAPKPPSGSRCDTRWARNPVANLYNKAAAGRGVRTDDWAGMTVNNKLAMRSLRVRRPYR